MTSKWFLYKWVSRLFIIIHLHRHNIHSLLTSCLFLSGFNAGCEGHHKTVFQNTHDREGRHETDPPPYGRGQASGPPLPGRLRSRCSSQGDTEAVRGGGSGHLRERLCFKGALSSEASLPLSREKPLAAGGKAIRAPGRWKTNI